MSDILKTIETYKRQEIAEAKTGVSYATMMARAEAADRPRGFVTAIEAKHAADEIRRGSQWLTRLAERPAYPC